MGEEDVEKLVGRLFEMADDIQIGGETNFRLFAVLLRKGKLTKGKITKVKILLKRAEKLLADLSDLSDEVPSATFDEVWK